MGRCPLAGAGELVCAGQRVRYSEPPSHEPHQFRRVGAEHPAAVTGTGRAEALRSHSRRRPGRTISHGLRSVPLSGRACNATGQGDGHQFGLVTRSGRDSVGHWIVPELLGVEELVEFLRRLPQGGKIRVM